ncbi:hypothetical protein BDV95DRAFT_637465 [Massariosphaeria phaeospora]|uniref:Uncharacterized protein n=1 Tax=Massariosphaeria phaeospora TaxID=100035 RepID=A0A7C8I522_9PLEO|nr:hypothetical protein BDV95DRAFT_637465 [Massariosphaeria phaeospora]
MLRRPGAAWLGCGRTPADDQSRPFPLISMQEAESSRIPQLSLHLKSITFALRHPPGASTISQVDATLFRSDLNDRFWILLMQQSPSLIKYLASYSWLESDVPTIHLSACEKPRCASLALCPAHSPPRIPLSTYGGKRRRGSGTGTISENCSASSMAVQADSVQIQVDIVDGKRALFTSTFKALNRATGHQCFRSITSIQRQRDTTLYRALSCAPYNFLHVDVRQPRAHAQLSSAQLSDIIADLKESRTMARLLR